MTGHTNVILASRVKGTAVFDRTGEKIGHIEDVVLDKQSDRIVFAALGFGGIFGVGAKFYPVPWSVLEFSKEKGGYIIPIAKDQIDQAPAYSLEDLTLADADYSGMREKSYSYYIVSDR